MVVSTRPGQCTLYVVSCLSLSVLGRALPRSLDPSRTEENYPRGLEEKFPLPSCPRCHPPGNYSSVGGRSQLWCTCSRVTTNCDKTHVLFLANLVKSRSEGETCTGHKDRTSFTSFWVPTRPCLPQHGCTSLRDWEDRGEHTGVPVLSGDGQQGSQETLTPGRQKVH